MKSGPDPRRIMVALALVALLGPPPAAAQLPAAPADSAALAAAGLEAGAQAGSTASLKGPIWSSAALTFLLTPLVGGLGSLVHSQTTPAAPAGVPDTVAGSHDPAYRQGYVEGYRSTYRPRLRRAVRTSVLVTSVLFVAGAAAFGG